MTFQLSYPNVGIDLWSRRISRQHARMRRANSRTSIGLWEAYAWAPAHSQTFRRILSHTQANNSISQAYEQQNNYVSDYWEYLFLAATCIATHNAQLVTRTGSNVVANMSRRTRPIRNAERQLADAKAGAANEPVTYLSIGTTRLTHLTAWCPTWSSTTVTSLTDAWERVGGVRLESSHRRAQTRRFLPGTDARRFTAIAEGGCRPSGSSATCQRARGSTSCASC
jgi:hypothetical protein